MKVSLPIILSIAVCTLAAPQAPPLLGSRNNSSWKVGRRVYTTSGPVDGHLAPNSSGVSEYLGIPFAQPPIGPLRFEAPQPYIPTPGSVINGSEFGFSCPQIIPNTSSIQETYDTAPAGLFPPTYLTWELGQITPLPPYTPIRLGEDCLTLNVWTKPQVGDKAKAILFWIYGGGWSAGASDVKYNFGQHLAEEGDVVVVTINYRLGILGFPIAPNLNVALLDQRLALEWIQANAASFGGDPTRITLIGQSGGAISSDYLLYSYPTNPIASSAILESGNVFAGPINTQADAQISWDTTSVLVGCGNGTTPSSACMKNASWESLISAPGPPGLLLPFGPTADEKIIFANYTERSAAGQFAKVPILIGNNDWEIGLFIIPYLLANISIPESFLTEIMASNFACPGSLRANISQTHDLPVWRYRWFGAFPDLQLTVHPDSGAWHGEEIAVIWNTVPTTPGVLETAQEKEVATYARAAWTGFVKDPEGALGKLGWPEWDPEAETLIRLAYGNETRFSLVNTGVYDVNCSGSSLIESI